MSAKPSFTTSISRRSEPGARAFMDPDTSTATRTSARRSAGYQVVKTWSTWCTGSTSYGGAVTAGSCGTGSPGGPVASGRRSPAAARVGVAVALVSESNSRPSGPAVAGSVTAAAVGNQL
jgi:hypothetical protein